MSIKQYCTISMQCNKYYYNSNYITIYKCIKVTRCMLKPTQCQTYLIKEIKRNTTDENVDDDAWESYILLNTINHISCC